MYYVIGRSGGDVCFIALVMAIVITHIPYIGKLNGPDRVLTHKAFHLELACNLCEPLLLVRADPASSHIRVRSRRPTRGMPA